MAQAEALNSYHGTCTTTLQGPGRVDHTFNYRDPLLAFVTPFCSYEPDSSADHDSGWRIQTVDSIRFVHQDIAFF